MNLLNNRTRTAVALAAVATFAPLAVATTASAAPARTAATSTYTSASYLQHALGLPASETNPAIKSVTYDRFQWLLRQDGNFAILIGDPTQDASFAARAQDVEVAADAAGVKDVYWFNPNLSGSAEVGGKILPNLDIRNPSGIALVQNSRDVYSRAWENLVGQYLGNGIDVTFTSPQDSGSPAVGTKPGTSKVNDYGSTATYSTEVGNTSGGALYDYATATPADVTESYFLVYNQTRTVTPTGTATPQPSKIASWVDLTDATSSTSAKANVTTAISAVGASNVDSRSEFAWWQSANNTKQGIASSSEAQGKSTPVLTEADNAAADGGWRVHQITYPELAFLLKTEQSKDAVLLFGGTWCPNTRPVISAVNKNAQENDVTVFNFDTILDGSVVGGGNSSGNPLQSRNTAGSNAVPTANNTPTFLYGDLVNKYLNNIKTEYDPASSSTVTYYPGGDTTKPLSRINKLQVPFVVSVKGQAGADPTAGVTRQWIIDQGEGKYKEYMSQYWYTRPAANQLGITTIPLDAPIWTKINASLATFTWQTDPTTLVVDTGIDTDDADFLVESDKAVVTYKPVGTTPASVSATANNLTGTVVVSPAALAAALASLGAATPVNFAAAKTAYLDARVAATPDEALIANLTTVVGAWGVAQTRKTRVNTTWGNATTPGSVAGGVAAIHTLQTFFRGLPGGVLSTQTVTADSVNAAAQAKVTVEIANEFGRVPTGSVSLVAKHNGTTVATTSTPVSNDKAVLTLPVLPAGQYELAASYAGDDQIASFTKAGSLTVTPVEGLKNEVPAPSVPIAISKPAAPAAKIVKIKAAKVAGSVSKAPTRKLAGKYKVKVGAATGRAAATGAITIKVKKGKVTKTLKGKLVNGVVTFTVPKLAKGTWKVTIAWVGDANYLAASVAGASIKVTK